MLAHIQKRIGIALGFMSCALSVIIIFDRVFIAGFKIGPALLQLPVWSVIVIGVLCLFSGLYISRATRLLQIFLVLLTGFFSALDAAWGNLTSVVWTGIGYLIAVEYGFLERRFALKSAGILALYLTFLILGLLRNESLNSLAAIHTVVGIGIVIYLTWTLIQVRNTRHREREEILEEEVKSRTVSIELKLTEIRNLKDDLEAALLEKSRLLADKDLLLKEVHHRTKNNMQLISSILNLEKENAAEPGAQWVLDKVRDRIYVLSMAHESIYQSESLEMVNLLHFITDIVANAKGVVLKPGVDCTVDIPWDLTIGMETAIPVGLIINELARNAGIHAFGGRPKGSFTVSGGREEGALMIRITDDGVGMPASFDLSTQKTLGLQIVKILVEQIKGNLAFERANAGTTWVLRIPKPNSR